jgi:ABC-type transport system involved in cytochrome c biogenesis permease subunit
MTPLYLIVGASALYALGLLDNRKGNFCYIAGFLLHLVYLTYRWVSIGHFPVSDKHDILVVISFISALSFFYLYYGKKIDGIMNILPLLIVALCILAVFNERMDTVNPFMNSIWFYLYMILFVVGAALLGVGSVVGVIYLKSPDVGLEILQYKFTLAGWLFFSFSLIAGSVWFYLAYGVYWLWTAKELWTTIVWFYYGFYLHSRSVESLKGLFASELGAAGFLVFLFSYLGVTPILGSPWTQF